MHATARRHDLSDIQPSHYYRRIIPSGVIFYLTDFNPAFNLGWWISPKCAILRYLPDPEARPRPLTPAGATGRPETGLATASCCRAVLSILSAPGRDLRMPALTPGRPTPEDRAGATPYRGLCESRIF
jgi:hypothetical protein